MRRPYYNELCKITYGQQDAAAIEVPNVANAKIAAVIRTVIVFSLTEKTTAPS